MANIKANQSENVETGAAPARSLKYCIDMVKRIVEESDAITPRTSKEIGIIISFASSSLIYPLSACVQYGLLSTDSGKGYLPTELFQKISLENDRLGLLTAFINPSLYQKIINELNGKVLPPLDKFINYLKVTYDMSDGVADRTARAFLENVKDLELIDQSNRLKFILSKASKESINENSVTEKTILKDESSKNNGQEKIILDTQSEGLYTLPVLITGDKIAYLKFDKKTIKARDIDIIKKALDLVKDSIQEEGTAT